MGNMGIMGEERKERVMPVLKSDKKYFIICGRCLSKIMIGNGCLCDIRAGMEWECRCGERYKLLDRRGNPKGWVFEDCNLDI